MVRARDINNDGDVGGYFQPESGGQFAILNVADGSGDRITIELNDLLSGEPLGPESEVLSVSY